jgi:hypothetical protein
MFLGLHPPKARPIAVAFAWPEEARSGCRWDGVGSVDRARLVLQLQDFGGSSGGADLGGSAGVSDLVFQAENRDETIAYG